MTTKYKSKIDLSRKCVCYNEGKCALQIGQSCEMELPDSNKCRVYKIKTHAFFPMNELEETAQGV